MLFFMFSLLNNTGFILKHKSFFLVIILHFFTCYSLSAQSWQELYNSSLNSFTNRDFRKTISEGEKALLLASSNNEKLFTLKILSATSYEIGNFKKGVTYAQEEINICSMDVVPDSVFVNSLNNLINNYLGLQDFKNAVIYQKQLVLIGQIFYASDNLEFNQYVSDLGYSFLRTNEFDSAIYYLSKANKYLVNIEGGAEDFLLNELSLGQAYYKKKEFISSLTTLNGLCNILENNQLDTYQIYAETKETLALVQSSIGKFKQSQESYELASSKYLQLGFSVNDLEAFNKQLALVYIKNEETSKYDSLQALYTNKISSSNLLINQLSLAYKRYSSREFSEAKEILNQVILQLNQSNEDEKLFAEAYLLLTRLNLEMYGNSSEDTLNISIAVFFKNKILDKEAEAYVLKSKIYVQNGLNEMAISSLIKAKNLSKTFDANYYLKYSISLDLLKIYLQIKNLSQASSLYNQIKADKLLVGSEFDDKLSYNYAILLQANGYNLEALNILELLITNAYYPDLLGYQQIIAKVYIDLGKAHKSLEIYNSINNYLTDSNNKNAIEYAENLVQLGRVYVVLGEFAKAENFYFKSIELLENNSSTSSRTFAATYNSYAIYQQTIGNYEKAKLNYSKAKFHAKDDLQLRVDILQNLATLSQYEGEYYDAIILLKEAVASYEAIYGKNHSYYATALQNLANAYNKYGDPLKAISFLEQAINIDKNNYLENTISYANKLHNMAVFLLETDELDKAKEILSNVLAIRSNLLGENHPDYIYSLYNMAVLMQKMDDNTHAKEYFTQVINKYHFQIQSLFPYLSEQEKSKYYSKIKEAFTAFQDFAIEYSSIDPSINVDLYNFQLNNKAILLQSTKSMKERIDQSNDTDLITLYNQWIELKTALSKYYSMSKNELELAGISIDEVATEANSLEKKISLKSKFILSDFSEKETNWKDIQSKLKDNEAAIELIRIKKNIRNDSIWYAALIIKQNASVPELVILYNGKELETKFFKLYINSIKFKRKDSQSYKNYWQPINEALVGVTKIYLSSDGIYNKINVGTIYNPNSEEYIIDKMLIHNVTNTNEITKENQLFPTDSKFNIKLIGDPAFSGTENHNFSISPLPGTRIEVETIDSLIQSNNIQSLKLLGDQASERNLKSIASPTILHIATHGFFLADKTPTEDMYSMENNPLMRSGLLLSGAENSFRGNYISFNGSLEGEDGILTAYEAMNMNLSNSDLVILSACETGLGEVINGEGVYGLQRAFKIAGANSILISLWKVNDESTKELMIQFYLNILKGIDKFEALNLAQKKLKEKYSLPYYWGAFVISGT